MAAWAIVVGINEYEKISGMRTLLGAVADAADFADWLLDTQGGQVLPEHLFLWTHPAPTEQELEATPLTRDFMKSPTSWPLVGPNFDQVPQPGELVSGISMINEAAVKAGCDRLYVFFAGHGARTAAKSISDEAQNCIVVGGYMKAAEGAGLVNADDMRRYLKNQGPAQTIIILDCCRNELPVKVSRPGTIFSDLEDTGRNDRMCGVRAAQEGAIAYEVPLGSDAKRGAFTQLLTYGLREVRDGNRLTIAKLDEYVTNALVEVIRPPKEQVPDFEEKPRPPKVVLVTGPPAGTLAKVRIVPSGAQAIELLAADESVVRTIDPAEGPITLPLPRGGYSLERGGQVLAAFTHVGPGTPDVVI